MAKSLAVIRPENHDTVYCALVESKQEAITLKNKINWQILLNAVWARKIDQMSTREVAEKYGLTQKEALRLLKKIASGQSGDARFIYDSDRQGVTVSDGTIFTYSQMSIDGKRGAKTKEPTHYIWFCS